MGGSKKAIRLIVFDEQEVTRRPLVQRLGDFAQLDILGAPETVEGVLKLAEESGADIILFLPALDEMPIIDQITKMTQANCGIIVVASLGGNFERELALEAGADRFFWMAINSERLVAKIEEVNQERKKSSAE